MNIFYRELITAEYWKRIRKIMLVLGLLWGLGGSMHVSAAYSFDLPKPVPELTGRKISDFLKIAASQEGYHESAPVADQKSESYFGYVYGNSTSAWCSEFLVWSAREAGIGETVIPTKRAAKPFRTYYGNRDRFFLVEGGIGEEGCGCGSAACKVISPSEIRPGDILLIETNFEDLTTLDHTAVCRGLEFTESGIRILTVEGNVNKKHTVNGIRMNLGTVVVRSREVNEIHGICRPDYGNFCEEYSGHLWGEGTVIRQASCILPEVIQYSCQVCGEKNEVENGYAPHKEITDPAIAPTCEIAGLTAGTHCTECGIVIQAQQPVEAPGHRWDAGTVQIAAKPLTNGWMRHTCAVCGACKSESIAATGAPKVGTELRDSETEAVYIVTKSGIKGAQAAYAGPTDRKTPSAVIRTSVTIDGITYRITSIADRAFANNKYLEEVVIPSGVKQIGSRAFYKCSRLQSITIKTKSLKKKRIGNQAWKGIHKKAVFYVPASKVKSYRTMFQAKGAKSRNVFRAY